MRLTFDELFKILTKPMSPKMKLATMLILIGMAFYWLGLLLRVPLPDKIDLSTSQWFLSTVYQGNLTGAAIVLIIFQSITKQSAGRGFLIADLIVYSGLLIVLVSAFSSLWLLGAEVPLSGISIRNILIFSFLGFFIAFSGWIFMKEY